MQPSLTVSGSTFDWGARTYVMGILNITPDSFSGDGLVGEDQIVAAALNLAGKFIREGADFIDVGGESTRPGAELVTDDDEIARVVPVVQAIAEKYSFIPISVDTYKANVAEAAIKAGAHLVNDVWGLRADPEMGPVVKAHDVPIILMHNRSSPQNVEIRERLGSAYIGANYEDVIVDVKKELLENVQLALEAGILPSKIILDPGIGFGKTIDDNLRLINCLDQIRSLGFPVLLGPSRKSFIGFTLDVPPDQRMEGTAAAVSVGIARGADVVRVHDVESMVRVAKMTDAIVRS